MLVIAYLNGEYIPADEAKISPLDRGFLFGDGIYEVTPSYSGQMVGFGLHLARLKSGLQAIGITPPPYCDQQWLEIARNLSEKNGAGDLGIYFQVTRGNEGRRFHGFPTDIPTTVFGMVIELSPRPSKPDLSNEIGLRVVSSRDMRWKRCDVKSTALLGNILHYQESFSIGKDETILYNDADELTEASSSNVFVVTNGTVATPPLDGQILPGISRHIALDTLRSDGSVPVEERVVPMSEVHTADEVWITNSNKQIAPVVEIDGQLVGSGGVGPVWEKAMTLFNASKFNY